MIRDVFEELEAICNRQGTALEEALLQDAADHLRASLQIRQPAHFLEDAGEAAAEISVVVHISLEDEVATLTKTPQGDWRLDSEPGPLADLLKSIDVRDEWSSDEILDAVVGSGVSVETDLRLDKSTWRAAIEASSGHSSWIGYSESSFAEWLQSRTWRQVAKELFSRPASLVLLFKWEGPAVDLGERLVVQKVHNDANSVLPADVRWPQEAEPEIVRAAHMRPTEELRDWIRLLLRVAAICGSELFVLANRASGEAESQALPVHWEIDTSQEVDPNGVAGILALVRWTSMEPTAVRLAIGWRVAAERIANPLDGPSEESVLSTAEIAYQSAIDATVRDALSRQLELERSFREIDASISSGRESMSKAVDATVTRALAGVVATGIAAVTADDFRGWLVVAAAGLVAAYLLFEGTVGLATHRRDIQSRLDSFEILVRQRGNRLAGPLVEQIETWKTRTDRRVRLSRIGLLVAAVVVLAGGIAGGIATVERPESQRNVNEVDRSNEHSPTQIRNQGIRPAKR